MEKLSNKTINRLGEIRKRLYDYKFRDNKELSIITVRHAHPHCEDGLQH